MTPQVTATPLGGWGAGTTTTRMTSKGALNWSIKTVTRLDGAASTKAWRARPQEQHRPAARQRQQARPGDGTKCRRTSKEETSGNSKRKAEGGQGRSRDPHSAAQSKAEEEIHLDRNPTWTGIPPGQETHLEGKPTWTYNGNNHY